MLNGYCPITLKKKSTINKKPPTRSKSAPRRSQSSLATRNLNSSSIRSQKVDEIRKEVQLEKKNKEAPINKNLKPAIRHRKDYQLWDAEGCINVETNKQTTLESNENNLHNLKPKMKNKTISRNNRFNGTSEKVIIDRIRPPSRAQSVIGFRPKQTKNNLDEFLDRQNRSTKKREATAKQQKKVEREQRNRSYMNDESRKILTNSQSSSDLLAPKKVKNQEDLSFQSEMSLTSNNSVKEISFKLNDARKIYFEMSALESQLEEEAKEMAECTFTPDLSLTKDSIKKVRQENEQNIPKKKKTVPKKKEKENKRMPTVKDVPKRTRYINELLSGLRTTPCY